MNNAIIYTRSRGMAADIGNLIKLATVMAEDMSKLIGIPAEIILSDYADELEFDVSHRAFNSLLREEGLEILPTETRILIEKLKKTVESEDER